jgi:hypothetical protein
MKIDGEFWRLWRGGREHVEYLLINDQRTFAMLVLDPL